MIIGTPEHNADSGGGGGALSPWTLLLLLGAVLAGGCRQQVAQSATAHRDDSLYQWDGQTTAELDARQAAAQGDYRVLKSTSRSPALPGIDPTQWDSVEQRCGSRFLAGSGDKLTSASADEHHRLLDYALRYNQVMLKLCQANVPA